MPSKTINKIKPTNKNSTTKMSNKTKQYVSISLQPVKKSCQFI